MIMTTIFAFSLGVQLSGPLSEIEKFRLFDHQPDAFLNELVAVKARYSTVDQAAELDMLEALIHKAGRWVYTIRSPSGFYSLLKSRVDIGVGAEVTTASGLQVRAPTMVWGVATRTLKTDDALTIEGENVVVTAVGGDFDLKEDLLDLRKNVVLNAKDLSIASERGGFDLDQREAAFSGAVKGSGTMGEWKSEWARLAFQPEEVASAPPQKTLKRKSSRQAKNAGPNLKSLVCRGQVIFKTKANDLEIHSEELEVVMSKKKNSAPDLHAKGQVVALKAESDLKMEAENISIVSLPRKKQEIRMDGGVVIHNRGRIARSRVAKIQLSSHEVTLSEEASIEDKNNRIAGKNIVFHLNDDRVHVREASGSLEKN